MSAPEPLRADHDISAFDCGKPALNEWLKSKSRSVDGLTARTFVVCSEGHVCAYYCLAAGSVERKTLPSAKFRKNTPEQVPVIIIARLAVAVDAHGYGLGSGLLKDALLRCIQVADTVGVRAVLVHAIDDEAVGFYRKHAFMESPLDPRTLLLPVEAIKGAASG